jgi:hypothetical protein
MLRRVSFPSRCGHRVQRLAKWLCDRGPGESLDDQATPRVRQRPSLRIKGQQTHNGISHFLGIVHDASMLAVHYPEAGQPDRRTDHGPTGSHGFKSFEAGSATDPQGNDKDAGAG